MTTAKCLSSLPFLGEKLLTEECIFLLQVLVDGKDSLLFQGLDVQVSIQTNRKRKWRTKKSVYTFCNSIRKTLDAHLAVKAPNEDLNLLKALQHYKSVDETISKATHQKMPGHLWYSSEALVALAFFDDSVPIEVDGCNIECCLLRKQLTGMKTLPKRSRLTRKHGMNKIFIISQQKTPCYFLKS